MAMQGQEAVKKLAIDGSRLLTDGKIRS